MILAIAAGGLRELLLRHDGHADQPLVATVPVATDKSPPDRVTGNEIGGACRCRCPSTSMMRSSGFA